MTTVSMINIPIPAVSELYFVLHHFSIFEVVQHRCILTLYYAITRGDGVQQISIHHLVLIVHRNDGISSM